MPSKQQTCVVLDLQQTLQCSVHAADLHHVFGPAKTVACRFHTVLERHWKAAYMPIWTALTVDAFCGNMLRWLLFMLFVLQKEAWHVECCMAGHASPTSTVTAVSLGLQVASFSGIWKDLPVAFTLHYKVLCTASRSAVRGFAQADVVGDVPFYGDHSVFHDDIQESPLVIQIQSQRTGAIRVCNSIFLDWHHQNPRNVWHVDCDIREAEIYHMSIKGWQHYVRVGSFQCHQTGPTLRQVWFWPTPLNTSPDRRHTNTFTDEPFEVVASPSQHPITVQTDYQQFNRRVHHSGAQAQQVSASYEAAEQVVQMLIKGNQPQDMQHPHTAASRLSGTLTAYEDMTNSSSIDSHTHSTGVQQQAAGFNMPKLATHLTDSTSYPSHSQHPLPKPADISFSHRQPVTAPAFRHNSSQMQAAAAAAQTSAVLLPDSLTRRHTLHTHHPPCDTFSKSKPTSHNTTEHTAMPSQAMHAADKNRDQHTKVLGTTLSHTPGQPSPPAGQTPLWLVISTPVKAIRADLHAFLIHQHLQRHQQLGVTGAVVFLHPQVAQEISLEPLLQQHLQAETLIIWLWVSEHKLSSSTQPSASANTLAWVTPLKMDMDGCGQQWQGLSVCMALDLICQCLCCVFAVRSSELLQLSSHVLCQLWQFCS